MNSFSGRLKAELFFRAYMRGNKLHGRATCCGQQATCCGQQVACCPQRDARPRNNFVDGNKQQHVALV